MKRLIIFITTFFLLLPIAGFAATAGPNNCGSGADISLGATAWTSPGNACTSGSSTTASSIPKAGGSTDYLAATNFSFAIPAGATINGIQVTFSRSGQTAASIEDYDITLTKNGTGAVGSNYAATTTYWPTSSTAANYGGSADLWGTSWTASDINASTFGLLIRATNVNASLNKSATVYAFVTITVTYTPPANGKSSIPGLIGHLQMTRSAQIG